MTDSLLARASRAGVGAVCAAVPPHVAARVWELWARPEQLEPASDWLVWLILAGRSWGKSRTGAELVRRWAMNNPGCHIALVARTAADARDVMVRALLTPWRGGALDMAALPRFEPSNRALVWSNGSRATTYSAEQPDSLRGPSHDAAWCDEIATWQYREETWHEGLKMGLRGTGVAFDRPRVVVTTTPRPIGLLRELIALPTTTVTRGAMADNRVNLPASYVRDMTARYGGTRLGRQELAGELLEDIEGALWTHDMIDRARVHEAPRPLSRVVVAVDPSGSAKRTSDEAGIVVAGVAEVDGVQHAYVLHDETGRYSPEEMARRACRLYHQFEADRLVAEDNFGGQIVADLIKLTDRAVAYKAVHASRGKIVRAEPIAALYEQGRVHHVGGFALLEDELCGYSPASSYSPGRLDALVWAVTDLMIGAAPPRYVETDERCERRI